MLLPEVNWRNESMLPMKNHNRSLCTDKYITRSKYIGEVTISQYSWKPPAENRERKRNEMKWKIAKIAILLLNLAHYANKCKMEMKWKLSLLHLQDRLKVRNNYFYSFSISHFVSSYLDLFDVNEIKYVIQMYRSLLCY